MQVKAQLNNIRIAPRKVRIVAGLIRGLSFQDAQKQLMFLVRRGSLPILKLLNSAGANAKHNNKLNPDDLYVSEIYVNEGSALKRGMSKSRGRVFAIKKRTSHITLTLSEKKDTKHLVKTRGGKSGAAKKEISEKKEESAQKENTGKPMKASSGVKKPAKRLTGIARRAFVKSDQV